VFVAAFSHFISPVDLLMAYGLANILAAIPITPGGLGVVEFVLVSMITGFGPNATQALSAVLAYRAVNFWLPIPFGGIAYASLEFERRPSYQRVVVFFHRRLALHRRTAAVDAPPASAASSAASEAAGPTPGISGVATAGAATTAPVRVAVEPGPPVPARPAMAMSRPTGPAVRAPREPEPAPAGGPWVPSGARHGETASMRGPAFGTDPAG
jgi:hypothetical protein